MSSKSTVPHLSSIRYRAGRGEPLLLLHGFSACADNWKRVYPYLEAAHDVVAVTYPGHLGGHPLPAGFGHSVRESVDLAEAELDAAGFDKVHIVGNSLGGWFALELARRGRAKTCVVFAPAGGWEAGSREQKRIKALFKRIKASLHVGGPLAPLLARFEISRRLALGEIVARPEQLTPAEARMLIEGSWRCDAFDGVLDAVEREPPPPPFATLPCPIRLVWGTRDRILPMPRYSDRWRRILPGAEWVELAGLGHVPMFDDAQACARQILDVTTAAATIPPTLRGAASARD